MANSDHPYTFVAYYCLYLTYGASTLIFSTLMASKGLTQSCPSPLFRRGWGGTAQKQGVLLRKGAPKREGHVSCWVVFFFFRFFFFFLPQRSPHVASPGPTPLTLVSESPVGAGARGRGAGVSRLLLGPRVPHRSSAGVSGGFSRGSSNAPGGTEPPSGRTRRGGCSLQAARRAAA